MRQCDFAVLPLIANPLVALTVPAKFQAYLSAGRPIMAVAGGETRIPTLESPLILKIPPRTNAGRIFRLRGKGMPHQGDPKTRGDLFALVRLVLPDPLTDQEVISIRELAASRPNPS